MGWWSPPSLRLRSGQALTFPSRGGRDWIPAPSAPLRTGFAGMTGCAPGWGLGHYTPGGALFRVGRADPQDNRVLASPYYSEPFGFAQDKLLGEFKIPGAIDVASSQGFQILRFAQNDRWEGRNDGCPKRAAPGPIDRGGFREIRFPKAEQLAGLICLDQGFAESYNWATKGDVSGPWRPWAGWGFWIPAASALLRAGFAGMIIQPEDDGHSPPSLRLRSGQAVTFPRRGGRDSVFRPAQDDGSLRLRSGQAGSP